MNHQRNKIRFIKNVIEQYFTEVLFVFKFYPGCNFETNLSILDLTLPGMKGLKDSE